MQYVDGDGKLHDNLDDSEVCTLDEDLAEQLKTNAAQLYEIEHASDILLRQKRLALQIRMYLLVFLVYGTVCWVALFWFPRLSYTIPVKVGFPAIALVLGTLIYLCTQRIAEITLDLEELIRLRFAQTEAINLGKLLLASEDRS
ncbi:hypothetical protein [Paraburkholderia sp. GAS82]|uniref:hypothetical protein n=1 Tax=Paraburkholderia sp. GAS82 TaxID=3035137 RepID=UPI003D1E91CA